MACHSANTVVGLSDPEQVYDSYISKSSIANKLGCDNCFLFYMAFNKSGYPSVSER